MMFLQVTVLGKETNLDSFEYTKILTLDKARKIRSLISHFESDPEFDKILEQQDQEIKSDLGIEPS
jgi:hypothetical protein